MTTSASNRNSSDNETRIGSMDRHSTGHHSADQHHYERSKRSETSESLCNFSNSTPYRIGTRGMTPFSSDEHGGIIGSPLSAFSAVGVVAGGNAAGAAGSSRGRASTSIGGSYERDGGAPGSGGSSAKRSTLVGNSMAYDGMGGIGMVGDHSGREASLLVSPRLSTTFNNETTPSTVRRQASPPGSVTSSASRNHQESRFNSIRSDLYDSASTSPALGAVKLSQRDPTPCQYRSNPLSSPMGGSVSSAASHSNNDSNSSNHNHLMRSGGSNRSDQSSRSGRDPPAKSPFGTAIVASSHHHNQHHSYKSTPNHHSQSHHYNEENELSMIQEDGSVIDESAVLNQSQASTVTALTAPRTPVMRKMYNNANNNTAHNPPDTASSIISGMGGFGHNTPMSTISTDKLLRRPSQAMRDSFSQLASHTAHQLEDIWDLVGVIPEERAAQLADLVEKISTLCDEKIAEERGLADQFRKEIDEARKEWEESCQALQIGDQKDPVASLRRDPSATTSLGEEEGISLQSEYEAILGRLESIRSVKAVATEDIVGSQSRIYEAYAALNGCSAEEATNSSELESWGDTTTDLTEERRELYRSKAQELEESVASRTKAVVSLVRECQGLIHELKIVPPGCLDDDEQEMGGSFCDSGNYGPGGEEEVGRSEDDLKIMKSLKLLEDSSSHGDGQRRRSRGRSASDYTIASLFESPTCTGIGKESLERLTGRLAELNGEKRRRRAKLGEMGTAIAALWTMLRVPQEEQRAFTESVRGLGMDTIRLGERELIRLHELKAVMIGKLIREQRDKIADLWEKTNTTDAEKASFDCYYNINADDKLTDKILAKHEEYVAFLNAKLEKMQPILDLIAKREAIIADRFELENFQKDPDRLKQRGASLTKQLMKEEKMSRRVQKELPKITQMLENTLIEWYEDNRPAGSEERLDSDLGHFMYQNAPYLKTIETQEDDWKRRKERGEQERQRKRQEERTASTGSAFGSSYAKLPGKKWHPSMAGPPKSKPSGPSGSDRPRSASNVRGRPLTDVSSSRQNVSRAASRPRNDLDKKAVPGNIPSYRATSAPRMRL